jgi:6-phosphogluconolactonase
MEKGATMPPHLVYIGTYTDPTRQAGFTVTPEKPIMGMTGPTGSAGIYVFQQDPITGALTHLHTLGGMINPSFLAIDPSRRFLFAVNEMRDHAGQPTGAVSSFAIDQQTGFPAFVSQVSSGGANPCHLSVTPDSQYLLVANHEDARVAVLPIAANGHLGAATDIRQNRPHDPANGRQPHAHFVTTDPAGHFVLSTDTGTDRIAIDHLDISTGRLVPHEPAWGATQQGGSPRHLAFHPNGQYLYANGEADLTISVFDYDAVAGTLTHRQQASTLPPGVTGQFSTAQIAAHPNGRFVYVANRGHDSIAIFGIEQGSGRVTLLANEPTGGRTPRNFALDPAGNFLYVANQNSESIVCFVVDRETGMLTQTEHRAHVPAPTCVLFADGKGH